MGQTVFVNKQFWEAHNYMTSSLWDQLQCSMCQAACHTHCFILSCVDLRGVRVRRCFILNDFKAIGSLLDLGWREKLLNHKEGLCFLFKCVLLCVWERVCVCMCVFVSVCLSVYSQATGHLFYNLWSLTLKGIYFLFIIVYVSTDHNLYDDLFCND